VTEDGKPGLPWRGEVLAQVFEEALVDLGRGVRGFFDARKSGTGRRRGFPRFKKRGRSRPSFRIRNKGREVRVSEHSIRLPKLGELGVRVRINVEAAAFHPASQHPPGAQAAPALGIDRGLCAFAVGATANGAEHLRVTAPKPLAKKLHTLRRASRSLSRTKPGGKGRNKARRRLARLHARIARIRTHFVHSLSSRVVKTHAHVALEDLHVSGMLRNRHLSRSISDAAWSQFAAQVAYKAAWYNGRVSVVDRYFPSSKRCHGCGHVVSDLPLSQRLFACPACRQTCDRDTNAAANCAQHADLQNVAAKRVETVNARRGEGAGRSHGAAVKPASMTRERRAPSRTRQTPGEGGVGLNVNAL
jgi:putative transposase